MPARISDFGSLSELVIIAGAHVSAACTDAIRMGLWASRRKAAGLGICCESGSPRAISTRTALRVFIAVPSAFQGAFSGITDCRATSPVLASSIDILFTSSVRPRPDRKRSGVGVVRHRLDFGGLIAGQIALRLHHRGDGRFAEFEAHLLGFERLLLASLRVATAVSYRARACCKPITAFLTCTRTSFSAFL